MTTQTIWDEPPAERRGVLKLLNTAFWAAASLGVFVLVVMWAYQIGVSNPSSIPAIQAGANPDRRAPADPGGVEVAGQGLNAHEPFGGAGVDGSATLAPIAERPLAEDVPLEIAPVETGALRALVADTASAPPSDVASIVDIDTLQPRSTGQTPLGATRPAAPPNVGPGSEPLPGGGVPAANASGQAPPTPAPAQTAQQPAGVPDPDTGLIAPPPVAPVEQAPFDGGTTTQPDGSFDVAAAPLIADPGAAGGGVPGGTDLSGGSLGAPGASNPLTALPDPASPSGALVGAPTPQEIAAARQALAATPQPRRRPDPRSLQNVPAPGVALGGAAPSPGGPSQGPATVGGVGALQGLGGGAPIGRVGETITPPVAQPAPAAPTPSAGQTPGAQSLAQSTPAPAPAPEADAGPAPTQDPAPVAETSPSPNQSAPPAPTGGVLPEYAVQLAALSSEGAAQQRWDEALARAPSLLGGRQPIVQTTFLPDRESGELKQWYRLRVGFDSFGAASDFCQRLREANVECYPVAMDR